MADATKTISYEKQLARQNLGRCVKGTGWGCACDDCTTEIRKRMDEYFISLNKKS